MRVSAMISVLFMAYTVINASPISLSIFGVVTEVGDPTGQVALGQEVSWNLSFDVDVDGTYKFNGVDYPLTDNIWGNDPNITNFFEAEVVGQPLFTQIVKQTTPSYDFSYGVTLTNPNTGVVTSTGLYVDNYGWVGNNGWGNMLDISGDGNILDWNENTVLTGRAVAYDETRNFYQYAYFDAKVSSGVSSVPEPSTISLLFAGLCMLPLLRLRKKKSI